MGSLADRIYQVARTSPAKNVSSGFTDPTDCRRAGEWLMNSMLQARRYYLDDDVTEAAATLGVMHPEILLQMLFRARAPHDKIWLEWPLAPHMKVTGRPVMPDAPDRVGCLIEALDLPRKGPDGTMEGGRPVFRMTVIGHFKTGEGRDITLIPPFATVYDLEDTQFFPVARSETELLRTAMGINADVMDLTHVGSAYVGKVNKFQELTAMDGTRYQAANPEEDIEEFEFRKQKAEELAKHATYHLTPVNRKAWAAKLSDPKYGQHYYSIIQTLMGEYSGMWRMAIATLALINAQNYVGSEDRYRAGKSTTIKGKIVPYLEHRIVKLKLPREVVVRKVAKELADAIPRRRHDVVGHWAQSRTKGNPNCDHAYVNETETRKVCVLCDHKIWWRPAHQRGDASIGYVTKDYVVTRS